jgi:hypothetical protein
MPLFLNKNRNSNEFWDRYTPFSGAPATIMMINHESFANDLPEKLLVEMSSSKEILSSKLYCLGKSNINLPGKLMRY